MKMLLTLWPLITFVSTEAPQDRKEGAIKTDEPPSEYDALEKEAQRGDPEEEGAALNEMVLKAKKRMVDDTVYDLRDDKVAEAAEFLVRQNLLKMVYIGCCPRDYANLECPLNWEKGKSGCIAPDDYDGPCGLLKLDKSTPQEKESLALRCRVQWPCTVTRLDFSGCPSGWRNKTDKVCGAPLDYTGICGPELDTGRLKDDLEKARMAAFCEFTWPPAVG